LTEISPKIVALPNNGSANYLVLLEGQSFRKKLKIAPKSTHKHNNCSNYVRSHSPFSIHDQLVGDRKVAGAAQGPHATATDVVAPLLK